MKTCTKCGKEKPITEFNKLYIKKYPELRRSECKTCDRKRPSQRRRARHNKYRIARCALLKQRAVEYLGGKCMNPTCPLPSTYQIPYYSFDFHHRDPSLKSFQIGFFIVKKNGSESCWLELQQEIDKCDLLCCLCHREYHYSRTIPPPS